MPACKRFSSLSASDPELGSFLVSGDTLVTFTFLHLRFDRTTRHLFMSQARSSVPSLPGVHCHHRSRHPRLSQPSRSAVLGLDGRSASPLDPKIPSFDHTTCLHCNHVNTNSTTADPLSAWFFCALRAHFHSSVWMLLVVLSSFSRAFNVNITAAFL